MLRKLRLPAPSTWRAASSAASPTPDYYQLLGISRDAPPDDIKRAFREVR